MTETEVGLLAIVDDVVDVDTSVVLGVTEVVHLSHSDTLPSK